MTDLIKYDAARHALQQAVEIDDVKNIRDKAQAMAAYARQANDTKLVEWATEIKVRAERKAGQMLSEMPKNPGKLKNSSWSHDTTTTKLSDLNITKDQSSRWQRLAAVPDDQFEKAISAAKEVAGEVTTAAMLRIEKALKDHKSSQAADVGETIMPNAIKQITPQKNKTQNSQEDNSDDLEQINKELSHEIVSLEEENQKLRDAIAAGQLPDSVEIQTAEEIIIDLRKQVKNLQIELQAVKESRDKCKQEIISLKSQCASQAKQLKRLGVANNA